MIATLLMTLFSFTVVCILFLWLRQRVGRGVLSKTLQLVCAFYMFWSLALVLYICFYLISPAGEFDGFGDIDGIEFTRIVHSEHDHLVLHVTRVDLALFELHVSPPDFNDSLKRYRAMPTSQALETYGGVLAVNASFFRPFRDEHLFDYYPHTGDPVEAIGKTIVNGAEFGAHGKNWPVLAISRASIRIGAFDAVYPDGEQSSPKMVVSGKSLLVADGVPVATSDGARYPRTAVGIDSRGKYLWLIVADGKQPFYSDGIDLKHLAALMVEFGIHDGIELDGGGSATMAAALGSKVKVISRPSHTNLPARERPVANHLIIKARL